MEPITGAIDIQTAAVPLVERWDAEDGPRYVLTFEDAGASVTLDEPQLRGLVGRALAAQLDEVDED